jgi:hypothetical protein
MASTTFGCAWPVLLTAMAALRSRNAFPSTSCRIVPAPRSGASGYARGSDGLVTRPSASMTARARGPGISVTRRGSVSAASASYGRSAADVIGSVVAIRLSP